MSADVGCPVEDHTQRISTLMRGGVRPSSVLMIS